VATSAYASESGPVSEYYLKNQLRNVFNGFSGVGEKLFGADATQKLPKKGCGGAVVRWRGLAEGGLG